MPLDGPRDPFSLPGGYLSISNRNLLHLTQSILAQNKLVRFRARGQSMFPFIRDNDILTVVPAKGYSLRIGTVVLYTRRPWSKIAVHRVVSKNKASWGIKGDNTLVLDGFFPNETVLGRVIRIERGGKLVRVGLGPEAGLIALLSRWRILPIVFLPLRRAYINRLLSLTGLACSIGFAFPPFLRRFF